jgi:hypothetical protein
MLISAARGSVPIVAAIDIINAQIAQVTTAISNNATLAPGGQVFIADPVTGLTSSYGPFVGLNLTDSQTLFNSILTILNSKLATANAALAAL